MAARFDGIGEQGVSTAREFSANGGWAELIEPHKGLRVDLLPAEWRERLRGIANEEGYITLKTMAATATRQRAATTVVKGRIDIRGFPEHLHAALKAFDPHNSGGVGAMELQHAAMLYSESKKTQMRMARVLATLFVTVLAVCGAVAGLTHAVVDGTKEVRASGAAAAWHVPVTVGRGVHRGAAVSTVTPVVELPLAAVAYIPEVLDGMVDRVELQGVLLPGDGSASESSYVVSVTGLRVSGAGDNRTLTIYTVAGDTIRLSSPADGLLTRRDGTTARFCGLCATCGVVNAVRTAGVARGVEVMRAAAAAAGAACRAPAAGGRRGAAAYHDDTLTLCGGVCGERGDADSGAPCGGASLTTFGICNQCGFPDSRADCKACADCLDAGCKGWRHKWWRTK